MASRDVPIRKRLMAMIMLTSASVLVVTCCSFFAYELLTFRQATVRNLTTIGEIIANNSTAALAFDNADDAGEVLAALRAERDVVAAALYDRGGRLLARYPPGLGDAAFPAAPAVTGFRLEGSHLIGVLPVAQGGNERLGVLYLKSGMGAIYARMRLYGAIAALVVALSLLVAYVVSRRLQQQISQPLLALAETARAVSDRRDYAVRAATAEGYELAVLTTAFNHMLGEIQTQHRALAQSEGRLRTVLDSALSAVIVIDAAGVVTDWNARAETMFGWSREEAIGRPLAERIIPPNYRDAHRRGLERYNSTGEERVLGRLIELSALRRDGSEFPVELSIRAIDTGGAVSFCGFVTDITERRQAARKLRAQLGRHELLNRITRAIGERQDLPSVFQVVVRSLENDLPVDFSCICLHEPESESLTVTSVGAASGSLATELAIGERARIPVGENGLSRCVRGQLVYEPDISELPYAFPKLLARGGLRSMVIAPLLTESRVSGVLVAAHKQEHHFESQDCEFLRQLAEHVALATHQMQLHGALQQAYDDLRQTQHTIMQQERLRALGQMASGIAHDINNAISPVALYTESLLEREPNLSKRTRDYLTTIQGAIEDVAETVARMREFYRPREPQLSLVRVALNGLVARIIELTRARWQDEPQQRGVDIELRTELEADLPGIMGAESEIRDAVTNLIFNAVDAMPDGGVLTLRTRLLEVTDLGGGAVLRQVSLEVSDTGIGMDEETRRRCLEPFYTTKGERGTGLGLAMVYGMVQRHSAELAIDSEVGLGTTVRMIFAVPGQAHDSTVVLEGPQQPARGRRVLLIDDDPLLIQSMRDILEIDGHLVTTADGGQAGIDAFQASLEQHEPFSIVITDLGMPYVDGRKVAAAVGAASPTTPVILLTGWGQRLVAEDDVPPHVSRVLNKPPRLHELRSALAELTSRNGDS